MGRLQLHFAWYMLSYTVLMLASYLLWNAAGAVADAAGLGALLQAASDFLINFAVFAYPLFAVIKAIIKRMSRRFDAGRRASRKSFASTKRTAGVRGAFGA